MSRTLGVALAGCGLVMIVDGLDLAAMPMTVPHVAAALGLPPARFGPALAAVLVGMGLGAVTLAPLGDRHGRRPAAIGFLALIGAATMATATAATLTAFLGWRLLTGLALGGCLPNVTALTAEISPRRMRARMMTITGVGASVGGLLGGLVIPPLIAIGGWPAPFLFAGGLSLLLAAILWATLPESPKFYAARKPAHPSYRRLARRLGLGDPAGFTVPPAPTAKVPLLTLFGRRYGLATALFAGLYMVNAVSVYMLSSWLPTVLPRAGFSLPQSARLAGLMQGGGVFGGIAISLFLDRGRGVTALIAAYVCVLAALAGFSLLPTTAPTWAMLLLVVGGGITGGHMALMAMGASLYPAAVLTSAIGFAVAVARIGAVGGPLVGQLLVASDASAPIFLLSTSLPVLACIGGLLLLPAAQRRMAERA